MEPNREAYLNTIAARGLRYHDALKVLKGAIDELPGEQRQLFVMRWIARLSTGEIAGKLNLPAATVERDLTAALGMCRERLAARVGVTFRDA